MTDRNAIDSDIRSIQRIDAVPRILSAVVEITGMRFAAVARVTESSWTTCAVRDDLGFGLAPGDPLELESTICNEIRQHLQPVVFGHASRHPAYATHHTPLRYGLESYISVPIFRRSGEFFGTLCAIDSQPADLDSPAVLKSVQLFAELIGAQLELTDDLHATQSLLRDAQLRERILETTETEIRDLLQPIVTSLYLLRTATDVSTEGKGIVADMTVSCEGLTRLLRARLDAALGKLQQTDESSSRSGGTP